MAQHSTGRTVHLLRRVGQLIEERVYYIAAALTLETGKNRPAGFYGASSEIAWFQEHIEAGVIYANRPQGATTGAWPGYQAFASWKGSGNTGKAIGSFYYLPQYLREQSQTVVD